MRIELKKFITMMTLFSSISIISCNSNNNADKTEEHNLSFQNKQRLKIKNDQIKSISIIENSYTFGELNKESELFSITYYDTNGCEIKREEHLQEDGTANVKYFHTYDSTGKRISTIDELSINNNKPYNKTIYRYDSYGNISEAVYYYMTGNVAWKELYHYNEKGLLDKIVQDNKPNCEYRYDSSNQLITSIEYKQFFETDYVEIWHYKYKAGKIFEALQYDEHSEPYKLRKYSYTYY